MYKVFKHAIQLQETLIQNEHNDVYQEEYKMYHKYF